MKMVGMYCWRRLSIQAKESEAGQSLIETALLLPVLSALLLGTVETARVAYAAIEVANAAHAGAQYGAQSGYTAADATGISVAAASDASNLTGLTTTSSYACVCSDGTSSTCQPSDCPSSHKEETVTVNTKITFDPVIHLPGLPRTYTLTGRAIQKCVQ